MTQVDAVQDSEVPSIVREEEALLERVVRSVKHKLSQRPEDPNNYDAELLALRDQLSEVRLEDAPAIIAQMERLQAVAARRKEVVDTTLDVRSPYFAHLRLKENGRTRDVCLGRATYLDAEHGVRVVDWRNAPVSRIYYRYGEGDSYEENFGERLVEGEVVARRDVTISQSKLLRVGSGDGIYVRKGDGNWRVLSLRSAQLSGGQGSAMLPKDGPNRTAKGSAKSKLGSGDGEDNFGRSERFLPEIAALLDRKQFEAISRPAAGIAVIQGGAGSGKTTIGLHRIAYLAFQAPKRFSPDRMIVLVPSRALCYYTSRVLPSLDVPNVPVMTMADWQHELVTRVLPSLPKERTEETPFAAHKVKKHPALLALFTQLVKDISADAEAKIQDICHKAGDAGKIVLEAWKALSKSPIAGRLAGLRKYLAKTLSIANVPPPPSSSADRILIEGVVNKLWKQSRDLVGMWSDILTDKPLLMKMLDMPTPPGLSPLNKAEIDEAHRWCVQRCEAVMKVAGVSSDEASAHREERRRKRLEAEEAGGQKEKHSKFAKKSDRHTSEDDDLGLPQDEIYEEETPRASRRNRHADDDHRPAYRDDAHADFDGSHHTETQEEDDDSLGPALDLADEAIFLRLYQLVRGPLYGKAKTPISYEHAFVDEVQDLSSIDLAVLVDCVNVVAGERSMTLAGDIAQRLTLDTGLGDFAPALEALGLPHVEVEPLMIGYRSTRQVLEVAREILGPIAPEVPPVATRDGAPVELHRFNDAGAAAAFLAGALRDLASREPVASVAVITRYAWHADLYHDVLSRAEIPNLRRVRDQEFNFKPGVDLTDVKQVKGLEWDYIIVLDVNTGVYPEDNESRHLLHIAATRAAHQLWFVSSSETPSRLLSGWGE